MPPRNRPPAHLPVAVLNHQLVVTACRERDVGKLFRLINNLTREPERFTASHIARRCEMTQSQVGEYMTGRRRATSLDIFNRVADGLHIPSAHLGLAPRPWEQGVQAVEQDPVHDASILSADAPWPLPASDEAPSHGTEEADDVYRRELLRLALAAGFAAPALAAAKQISLTEDHPAQHGRDLIKAAAYESAVFGQHAGVTNIHPEALDQLDADIERIGRAYLTQPLTELITEIRYIRNMVFTALEGRQYPSQTRHLYLHAAQLCGLLASASSDLGHYDAARTHARTAAICAELAGHPSTTAWIAATQSLIEFWDDRPTKARQRAFAGHEYATCDADALRLHSLEARASARLGDTVSVHQAVSQITTIMDRTDTSAHNSIFDFSDANALRCAGSSYLWLNEFADAQHSLSRALEIFEAQPDGGSYAHIAVTRIDLSLAYLGSHEFDAAHETLRPVLELSPDRRLSGALRRFDDLRAALASSYYNELPAARDLTERLNALSPQTNR